MHFLSTEYSKLQPQIYSSLQSVTLKNESTNILQARIEFMEPWITRVTRLVNIKEYEEKKPLKVIAS